MGDVEVYDAGGAAANAAGDSAHLADTVDAHDASAISYAGSNALAATDVEAALDELDAEKMPFPHPLKPSGATLYENFPRHVAAMANLAELAEAQMSLTAIWLPAGLTVTSISFFSNTQAAVTPVNQWFALYDSARALLRQTVDDTTTAWNSSTKKTLALTSAFVTTYTGLHYLGICVKTNAGTVPSLLGVSVSSLVLGETPILTGRSDSGLVATAPNPAAAITATPRVPYCQVV